MYNIQSVFLLSYNFLIDYRDLKNTAIIRFISYAYYRQ